MTQVEVVRKDGHIVSLKTSGHTGYGVEGEDIVCAALSSVIQTAIMGLLHIVGKDTDVDGTGRTINQNVKEEV